MAERYISGQKGYEKTDTVPVIDEEKEKAHKTGYITLYNKLFGWAHQKSKKKKSKSFYNVVIKRYYNKLWALVLKGRPCT